MQVLEEMSNSQLQIAIKEMEHEHEAIKMRMLAELNRMEEIEERYIKAKEIILKRLKR